MAKRVKLADIAREAGVSVTAASFYINGKAVGRDWLAPGFTQYNKTHPYQVYDVTGMVRSGANAMGAVLAEGWWSGGMTFTGENWNYFGDRQSLLAKLTITYADGSVERVKVTADMVSGFSSAVATSSGKMTISYGGKSIDWIYRVTGSGGIQTTFRLKIGYTPGESFGSVTVSAEGVSGSSNGIYAVAFDLVLGSGIAIAEGGITCGVSGFKSAVNADGSNIRIVLWSADGVTSLNEGATLVLFGISGSKGTLTVQNASVSDGVSDYTVPATSYAIG